MINKFLNIALLLSIGTFTLVQAKSEYEDNYNNNTINVPSSKNDKIFIREYKYNASDTDSKVSSRKKAIAQLKSILSEEVGVHITSSLEMKDTVRNGVNNKYFKSEISQLTASITKLKILDEKWNGVTYYIKASVKVNEEQTMKLLIEAIKAKASKKDVKRLNKILKEQNGNLDKSYSKINLLQKKLLLQEIQNQASKNELADTKRILQKLQREKQKYDNQVKKQKNEIVKVKQKVKQIKYQLKKVASKACAMESGISKKNVESIIGLPITVDDTNRYGIYCNSERYIPHASECRMWYYGNTELVFGKNGILERLNGCK